MTYQILQLILYFVKKVEKYFDDGRINALKLQLEGLPAALASNLQNHFAHLPAPEHPTVLRMLWEQWLFFTAHQIYTDLAGYSTQMRNSTSG